jgi:uncharacterized protein YaaR (DUF327 family)
MADLPINETSILSSSIYQSTLQQRRDNEKTSGAKTGRASSVGQSRFAKLLATEETETQAADSLDEIAGLSPEDAEAALLDAVHSTGDSLSKHPNKENILEYKRSVRRFMDWVVRQTFEYNKSSTFNIRKREEQSRSKIKVINDKLEKLAAAILQGQSSNLKLLERVEEINGMLVDLLS